MPKSKNKTQNKHSHSVDDVNVDNAESDDSLYSDVDDVKGTNNKCKCPCNTSDSESWKLLCSKCEQTWHSSCANLKGISKEFVLSLVFYHTMAKARLGYRL